MDRDLNILLREFEQSGDPRLGYELASQLLRSRYVSQAFYEVLIKLYEDDPGDDRGLAIATLLLQKDSLEKIEENALKRGEESAEHRAAYLAMLYVYAILFDFPLETINLNFEDNTRPIYYPINPDHNILIHGPTYVSVYSGRNPLCCYLIDTGAVYSFVMDFKATRKTLSEYYQLEAEYPEFRTIFDPKTQKFIKHLTPERVIIISENPSYDYKKGRPILAAGGGRVRWRKPEGLVSFQLVEDLGEIPDKDDEEWYNSQEVLFYLNSYITGQTYGGAEEGGWWYTTRDPQSTALIGAWKRNQIQDFNRRRFNNNVALEDLREEFPFISLLMLCYELYENQSDPTSLEIVLEERPAVYSPQERPRYE